MAKQKAKKPPPAAKAASNKAVKWKRAFTIPGVGYCAVGSECTQAHRQAWANSTNVKIDKYLE